MKTEKLTGEISTAYGKKLETPLPLTGEFQAFEKAEEIRSAGQWPSDSDIVKFKNAQLRAKVRSERTVVILGENGYEAPAKDDPQVVMRRMINDAVLSKKYTEAQATEVIEGLLGYKLEA